MILRRKPLLHLQAERGSPDHSHSNKHVKCIATIFPLSAQPLRPDSLFFHIVLERPAPTYWPWAWSLQVWNRWREHGRPYQAARAPHAAAALRVQVRGQTLSKASSRVLAVCGRIAWQVLHDWAKWVAALPCFGCALAVTLAEEYAAG